MSHRHPYLTGEWWRIQRGLACCAMRLLGALLVGDWDAALRILRLDSEVLRQRRDRLKEQR